ncbi:MAG TPA: hypothetical protein PKX92_05390 [Edaphocola sp.]|nr:hypothetical protein [Edaphocola sp.]
MKKLILSFPCLLVCFHLNARNTWKIEAGIGGPSYRVFIQNNYIGGHYFEVANYYSLGMNYLMLNQRLHLGIKTLGGFEKGNQSILNMPNDSMTSYKYHLQEFGVMANVNYDWIKYKNWSFNSGVAFGGLYKVLGTSLSPENKKSYHFIYQLDALKVRFGRDLGIFAKAGWGIEGAVGIGVNYRF